MRPISLLRGLALASILAGTALGQVRPGPQVTMQPAAVPPAAPTGVTLTGTAGAVTVKWTAVVGATGYHVLRSTSATAPATDISGLVTTTSVIDKTSAAQTTYSYRVAAVYANGTQGTSPPLSYTVPAAVAVTAPAITPNGTVAAVKPAPPPGPAPYGIFVTGTDPAFHTISWSNQIVAGVSFQVYRQTLPNTAWQLISTRPLKEFFYYVDTMVLSPNTTTYRIVANYTDGRQGSTDFPYPNPPAMLSPTQLTATQVGDGKVLLSWLRPRDGAGYIVQTHGYKLYGSGLPASGQVVTGYPDSVLMPAANGGQVYVKIGAHDTVRNVPIGAASFRVASWYLTGASTANVPSAALSVGRWTGHYRVTFNGFVVNHETKDDILSRDGKYDEVYAAAHVFTFSRARGNAFFPLLVSSQLLTSSVYGDNNGFPARIRAGSASASGGLMAGDRLPVSPALPSTAPTSSTFPFLVWDASITANDDVVIIAPAIWEWDGNMTTLNAWSENQRTIATSNGTGSALLAVDVIQQALRTSSVALNPFLTWKASGQPTNSARDQGNGVDRPIGMTSDGYSTAIFKDMALILSVEYLERVFAAAGSSRVVVPINFKEVNTGDPGDYTLYVQIERLP
jgi:hypothetical protein